jgi:hypothetical protein
MSRICERKTSLIVELCNNRVEPWVPVHEGEKAVDALLG